MTANKKRKEARIRIATALLKTIEDNRAIELLNNHPEAETLALAFTNLHAAGMDLAAHFMEEERHAA
tara:strand:- start:65 stop:265 length:201 start_codon:yes stop_codon:yes gene_type:complete